MVCGINLLYQNVSNVTNCNLDLVIFDPLPRKIFQNKKGLWNFAAYGKLDLRQEIIKFLVNLTMEVKKGFKIGFWVEPFYLEKNIFWKKNCFESYRGQKITDYLFFIYFLWFFDTPDKHKNALHILVDLLRTEKKSISFLTFYLQINTMFFINLLLQQLFWWFNTNELTLAKTWPSWPVGSSN